MFCIVLTYSYLCKRSLAYTLEEQLMNLPSVKKSFANRLTMWITVTLLIVMLIITLVVSVLVKKGMTKEAEKRYQEAVERTNEGIGRLLSNVEVGVINNVHDIEENMYDPDRLRIVQKDLLECNPDIFGSSVAFISDYSPEEGRLYELYMKRGENGRFVSKQIANENHNYLEMEWFEKPLKTGKPHWSQPYYDEDGAEAVICSYSYPIKDHQGKMVGVIGNDMRLDVLSDMLERQDDEMNNRHAHRHVARRNLTYSELTHSFIIGRDGAYITHHDHSQILKKNFFEDAHKTLDDADDKMIDDMKAGKSGNKQLMFEGIDAVVYYAPLRTTGWLMIIVVPKISLYGPGTFLVEIVALFMFLTLIGINIICRKDITRQTKPLTHFAVSAQEIAKGNFDTQLPQIYSKDEIGLLHDSFEHMQRSLTQYVEELKVTTASQAAINRELELAGNIQKSMLPKKFPPFPERKDLDLYGLLTPAKAVGGDLFDFYIRDEHLFFCIGDVSGKGVPAAMVMTVTKHLFRAASAQEVMPERIVTNMNTYMSEGNDNAMFVTLFVGVLDLATGDLCYCNAGHEAPLYMTQELNEIPIEANFPVGLMPGLSYMGQRILMEPDTMLFFYTDGLTEAEDDQKQQFGKDRLRTAVWEMMVKGDVSPQKVVEKVEETVKAFVGGAEQSDDLTMLALKYCR